MPNRCQNVYIAFSKGFYSCHWKHDELRSSSTSLSEKCWWWIVLLVFCIGITWIFCWGVFSNDYNDFNWFIYDNAGLWFGWGILILSVFVIVLFYLLLIVASGFGLILLNESRALHLSQKVITVLILILCISGYILVSKLWNEELYAAVVAVQMLGPWLHISFLAIFTAASFVIYKEVMQFPVKMHWVIANVCILIVFLCICLIPLFMNCPCIRNGLDSIQKPGLIAHRLGIAKNAPENTILAYEEARKICNNFAVETDVLISLDGIPFIFHDTKNLKRTTNVEKIFPDRIEQRPDNFTWSQLQQLDAGSWFLEQDPYRTVRSMSNEYRNKIRKQKIPSLYQIASLLTNESIIFDLYSPYSGHPFFLNYSEVALESLLRAGLPQDRILWLPGYNRSTIYQLAPDIKMVAIDAPINYFKSNNISIVNLAYYATSPNQVTNYLHNNISVLQYRIETPWLFSSAWCQGITYVTTSSCNKLTSVSSPIWTISTGEYTAIWICTDLFFLVMLVVIFRVQYFRSGCVFLPIGKHRLLESSVEDSYELDL